MYLLDKIGRRPIYIFGGFFMGECFDAGSGAVLTLPAFWMFCVSGFGGTANPSTAHINMVVASTIMFGIAFGLTWAPAPYTTAAEMASGAVRLESFASIWLIAPVTREDHGGRCCIAIPLRLGSLFLVRLDKRAALTVQSALSAQQTLRWIGA
jgi:hypothetical protein